MRKGRKTEPYSFSVDMVSHTERDYTEEVNHGQHKYVKYGPHDDLPEYQTRYMRLVQYMGLS